MAVTPATFRAAAARRHRPTRLGRRHPCLTLGGPPQAGEPHGL